MSPREVNLHPENHLPDALSSSTFDVIVIGSGPTGRQVGSKTAAAGLSSVIIEDELWGGDCPYWACMPSKAILRPGEALAAARQVGGASQLIATDRLVDVPGVFERRDKIVHRFDDQGIVNVSLSQKCAVVRGRASLAGEKKVVVKNVNGQEKSLTANHAVVVATGSSPIAPPIKGIDTVDVWTPREATSASTVPEHLIIIGSGVVGCEMATAFATFGGQVTMISSSPEILTRFEPEAGRRVRKALAALKVGFHLSSKVVEVCKDADQSTTVKLSDGTVVKGSVILLATGREPRTATLGFERVGLPARPAIDRSMCVSGAGEWLYIVGDANDHAHMTHMGEYQGRVAAAAIIDRTRHVAVTLSEPWSKHTATADEDAVPQVVVTDPQVASVGLTLAAAKKRGIRAVEVTSAFGFPGANVFAEFDYDGWAQWVVDAGRNVLVGATFVGREVGDLLHPSTVALVAQIPLDRLRHAVTSFPTRSEIYLMLQEKWEQIKEDDASAKA